MATGDGSKAIIHWVISALAIISMAMFGYIVNNTGSEVQRLRDDLKEYSTTLNRHIIDHPSVKISQDVALIQQDLLTVKVAASRLEQRVAGFLESGMGAVR